MLLRLFQTTAQFSKCCWNNFIDFGISKRLIQHFWTFFRSHYRKYNYHLKLFFWTICRSVLKHFLNILGRIVWKKDKINHIEFKSKPFFACDSLFLRWGASPFLSSSLQEFPCNYRGRNKHLFDLLFWRFQLKNSRNEYS